MTAALTIILPHKRNPGNDMALRICLDMLMANTVNDFILLMDAAENAPLYPRVNAMVQQATTECLVYTASDTFFAPGWDIPMLELWNAETFVTNVVVEPGAIAMHHMNLHKDFGRKPETFRRNEFENWAADAPFLDGEGWYAPVMFPRSGWLEMGGLQTDGLDVDHRGFTSADIVLFEKWKAADKFVRRAKSYCYHLQGYSDEAEQMHEKRRI